MVNASMGMIAKLIGVSTGTVLRWVRNEGQNLSEPNLQNAQAKVIQIDEMWHFVMCQNDFEAYHQLIPEGQLFTGKDLTFPIEQDNSNTRHYLARFRRKPKVTSISLEMVDLSLRLLYHFSDPLFFQGYLDIIQSTFV